MRLDFEDGKYTYCVDESGRSYILRYGEIWRDVTGDKFIHAMAVEIEELRLKVSVQPENCIIT